jgi:hypothetical protein
VLETTPTQLAVVDPVPGHGETEAIDIPTQGLLHAEDEEKGHRLLDVGLGCHIKQLSV